MFVTTQLVESFLIVSPAMELICIATIIKFTKHKSLLHLQL